MRNDAPATSRHARSNERRAGLLLAAAFVAAPASGDPLATGGRIFGEACASCHGAGAAGLAPYSGSLGDFREILSGKVNRMPDFHGVFSDEEIAALYAYVREIAR